MKLKKIIKAILLTIFFVFLITSYSNAAEGHSMKLRLSSDNQENNVGDIISVDVYIDNIKGFSGINTFAAKKVYDNQVLEYIETIVANSNWDVIGDGTNIVLRKMQGEDLSKGKLCTMKFKVKKAEDTTVQLSEVDACNDEGDVYYEDGNVNSPSIQITSNGNVQNNEQGKSYIGIIFISLGILGLIGIGIHYVLNKNK